MARKMMSCGSWFLWILGLGIILAMVGNRCVHAVISCQDALVALLPCKPFVTGGSPSPSAPCCEGVSKLNAEASTTEEHRELCRCLKDAAHDIGVMLERAKELPQKCGVNISMPIDPNIDCDT
ncbi:hypothetical protein SLA2020_188380 [Shorea laevis]